MVGLPLECSLVIHLTLAGSGFERIMKFPLSQHCEHSNLAHIACVCMYDVLQVS